MNYTKEDLISISYNQLNPFYYERALAALNGLTAIFSKDWVENELAYFYKDAQLIKELGQDRTYTGISKLEKIVFLWEDLELINKLNGFSNLISKLNKGLRFDNIDLEISLAADIIKFNAEVELEPLIDGTTKRADCRFKLDKNDDWVYAEITRKIYSTTQKLIDERGSELSKLVSAIKADKRCVLVIKTHLKDDEYELLINWLKSKPEEGEFEDKAVFFTVPHNHDETLQALTYTKVPVTVRQGVQSSYDNSFGVVYFHTPDYGAENKLVNKHDQLPDKSEGILFIDITVVAGGFEDWTTQIESSETLTYFSAVVLIRDLISARGHIRELKIIENPNSRNILSENTKLFLQKMQLVKSNKNLMI